MEGTLQSTLSLSDHNDNETGSTMTVDKENGDTLNVEVELEDEEDDDTKTNNRSSSSNRKAGAAAKKQLYVQVKRKRVRRQYRRNQDAINFLRRFTLAVVLIDLILSISESSLISTFFLFVTLSTTFDVKPENVVDTYCYYYQGGGNPMCEQYMERVTGFTSLSTMSQHHHRGSASSPENHFPSVPNRPPLPPSESRKLFLAYNQSLYDFPARFTLAEKIDKDSQLSKLYSRLIYRLLENKKGILNDTRPRSEFLKKENNNNDFSDDPQATDNFTEANWLLLHASIAQRLVQSIQVIPPHASALSTNSANHLLFSLCSKTLDKLRTAAQKMKQKRSKDAENNSNSNKASTPTRDPVPAAAATNPLRKNLIQPTDFSQHRWKRDAVLSTPPGNHENEHVGNKGGGKRPAATGSNTTTTANSNNAPVERKKGATDEDDHDDDDSGQQGKGKQEGSLVSSSSSSAPSTGSSTTHTQHTHGSGYRLIKGYSTKKESVATARASLSRREVSHPPVDPSEMSSLLNHTKEHCKSDDIHMMMFTMSREQLHALLLLLKKNNNSKSHVNTNKGGGGDGGGGGKQKRNNRNVGEVKLMEELFQDPFRKHRHIMSLMEVSWYNNWQQFAEIAKRLSLHYVADDDSGGVGGRDDKDEYLIWSSIREQVMSKLVLNMETDIFSQESFRKAERRKRAVEQMYHDYSFTILDELKNVKDMSVSRTFYGIYWVIKIYVMTWQTSVCMVLFFGSVFEDKTALNIWGIFNILTSLLHFMVDDWINTTFQPEKTSASIWFGVIYGVYKPITILLVATLSSEIFKNDGADKKGVIARVREIIRGRKRPSLIGEKCLGKLRGLFITSQSLIENNADAAAAPAAAAGSGGGGDDGVDKKSTSTSSKEKKNNESIVYKGIKTVNIRAKIKRMEVNNGNLVVITQTVTSSSGMSVKAERSCVVCGTLAKCRQEDGIGKEDNEKMHEGYVVYPSPHDNEAGMTAEDLYPEDTEDEEEDENELEEVVDDDDDDDDDDESDEEEDGDNEECSHPDHDLRINQRPCAAASGVVSNDGMDAGRAMTGEKMPADITTLSEASMSGGGGGAAGGGGGTKNNGQSGLSLIAYAGNGIQGNLLHDSNTRAPTSNGQGDDDLLHGPIVDGGNLHI